MKILGLNAFQLIFLLVDALLFALAILAASHGKTTRRETLVWCALCLAAAIAVVWPRVTEVFADALGIGRGADLILYLAVALMMVGFWTTYMKLRTLRREVTTLVRHIALLEAERGGDRGNEAEQGD